ncbi:MAG: DUF1801 domain-containing protein [Candidatus Pacearchaeota archaeon]|jgi:uncharacterized protein YdhG (YjbR/CyaY superfamily)
MNQKNDKINSIDNYIKNYPKEVQDILFKLKIIIKKLVPKSEETISYGIPTFKLNGNLVHFAAFKNHIGFYPTPSAIVAFKGELLKFETSKGAIKFPIDKPIPYDLIKRIVKYRLNENKKLVSK